MTATAIPEGATPPPAVRPWRRRGMSALVWMETPKLSEVRIDRAQVAIRGRIDIPPGSIPDWRGRLDGTAGFPPVDFLTGGSGPGNTHIFEVRKNSVTFGGRLRLVRYGGHLSTSWSIKLDLDINPTRTFSHLGSPRLEEVRDLDAQQFFAWNRARAREVSRTTLDGNDNCGLDETALQPAVGGQPYGLWLNLYEQKLRELWRWALFPTDREFAGTHNLPAPTGELTWERLTLRQVEAYFERFAFHAPTTSTWIAQHLLPISRAVSADVYRTPSTVEHAQSSIASRIPLTQDVHFVAYSKTRGIVRFEIRHNSPSNRLGRQVRQMINSGAAGGHLSAKLQWHLEDARRRFQPLWSALSGIASASTNVDVAQTMAELADHVQQVCVASGDGFRLVLAALLRDGRLCEQGVSVPSASTINALVRRGVIARRRILLSEPRGSGRIYSLTPRFAQMRVQAGLALPIVADPAPASSLRSAGA